MKEKSYTELMKISAMKRNQMKENYVRDLYIEMLLTEIQLNIQKEKLLQKIDSAIDRRDRNAFMILSGKLKEITKQYGN